MRYHHRGRKGCCNQQKGKEKGCLLEFEGPTRMGWKGRPTPKGGFRRRGVPYFCAVKEAWFCRGRGEDATYGKRAFNRNRGGRRKSIELRLSRKRDSGKLWKKERGQNSKRKERVAFPSWNNDLRRRSVPVKKQSSGV